MILILIKIWFDICNMFSVLDIFALPEIYCLGLFTLWMPVE
jgi:hypothetical protein